MIDENAREKNGFSSISLYSGKRGRAGDITQVVTPGISLATLVTTESTSTGGHGDSGEVLLIYI